MTKKKQAFLREENLLTLLSQNNFIVPEIQREYVWGENTKVINDFLKDLKNKIGVCCSNCNLPSSNSKINIGFLYSYKPDYVKIEHDRFLDENLIDGQQRFTTLFLLLFYCSLKEGRKYEFTSLIRFEEKVKMSLDFKVRDLTRRFLLELVEKTSTLDQLRFLTKQTWFLKDYENDVSIKSMCKALTFIDTNFSDNTKYYNHLINYIVFWHFKTEATSQGEELYITMNARGEELADNEVTKAALMVNGAQLPEWGKKWEEWQQFFWKNRDLKSVSPNADNGFNGFLSCIAGLECYLKESNGEKPEKDIQKLLTLEKVEGYYKGFKLLYEKKDEFIKPYRYYGWVDKCLSEMWTIINSNNTNWFADYTDDNRGSERNRMVFLWSVFHYLNTKSNHRGGKEAFRVLRVFYIRFKNFDRSVTSIKQNINDINEWGPWKIPCNEEERLKHYHLGARVAPDDVNSFEETIWEIEDHPLNLDGRDVGNINISHLIDLTTSFELDELHDALNSFNVLFPQGTKNGSAILKTILLYYGDFWEDLPYSYGDRLRYDFSDWKKNIRKPEFKKVISDLRGKTPEVLLTEIHAKFLEENKSIITNALIALPAGFPLRSKLFFYSLFLSSESLWAEGNKVIVCDEVEKPRLFEDENKVIYNSKGTFKGHYGNTDLWRKIVSTHPDPLSELKSRSSI